MSLLASDNPILMGRRDITNNAHNHDKQNLDFPSQFLTAHLEPFKQS